MAIIHGHFSLPGTFTNARAGYAEPHETQATLAIFDTFEGSAERTTHGEMTEAMLFQRGGFRDEDVQRVEVSANVGLGPLRGAASAQEFSWELDNFIVQSQADLLRATSEGLERVLDGGVTTVSQSMGLAPSGVTRALWEGALRDPSLLDPLVRELGATDPQDLLQKLADRVHTTSAESPMLGWEKERYEELSAAAERQGITHVLAAGNDGDFAQALARMGIKTEPGFYESVLANEHKLMVGATDGLRPASFTSPNAGAEVAAPGLHVPVYVDGRLQDGNGTSIAAPQLAALAARAREFQPGLTPAQVERLLKQCAAPSGPAFLTGAGQVYADRVGEALAELY